MEEPVPKRQILEKLLAVTTELESNMKWGRVCTEEIHVRKFTTVVSGITTENMVCSVFVSFGSQVHYSFTRRSSWERSVLWPGQQKLHQWFRGAVYHRASLDTKRLLIGRMKFNFLLEELWSDFPSSRVPAHPSACGSSPHSPSPTTAEGATYLLWDPQ